MTAAYYIQHRLALFFFDDFERALEQVKHVIEYF